MTKINYKAVLSLTEPNHQIFLRFRQDDTQTQTLSVEITANGRLFPFVGYTVEFVNITRSDSGQPIVERVDKVYPQEARIEFTLGARSLQWLGKNKAYFSFKDESGNEVFSTNNFEYEVIHGVHNAPILDSGYIWAVKDLIDKANELVEYSRELLDEEAETRITTELYNLKHDFDSQLHNLTHDFDSHMNNKHNPHNVTKTQIGLGNVQNYEVATSAQAKAGTATNVYMTPKLTQENFDSNMVVRHMASDEFKNAKSGEAYLTRIGDIVVLNGRMNTLDSANSSNNAFIDVLNIPEGFRPTIEANVSHDVPAMFDSFPARVTSGVLKLKVAMNGSHWHNFSASWTTSDEFPR